jgi:hypothetical protein
MSGFSFDYCSIIRLKYTLFLGLVLIHRVAEFVSLLMTLRHIMTRIEIPIRADSAF